MYYLPLLIVCSLNPGFVGDQDSGPTCIQFKDAYKTTYLTLSECSTRLREILDEVMSDQAKLHQTLPSPWRYTGKCIVEVLNDTQA